MRSNIEAVSLKRTGRLAGVLLLCSLLIPLLNWVFVLSRFVVQNNPLATAKNMLANQFLFRISVINQVVLAVVVLLLGVVLYRLLKLEHKKVAILAFALKIVEATLTALLGLANLAALLLLKEGSSHTVVSSLVGSFINVHVSLTTVVGVFMAMNLVLFLYLLCKSKYVPRTIAGFGFVSYLLVFMYDFLLLLLPDSSSIVAIQYLFWVPMCLFVLVIFGWLLIKGVNVEHKDNHRIENVQ